MKRHPVLQQLSREHHHALVLGRRAIRWSALDRETRAVAWRDLRTAHARELEPHFREEETELLPLLGPEHPLVRRTLADHRRLRELLDHGATARELRELGEVLIAHVRFEERELFPRLEAHWTARTTRHEGAR